MRISDWSSDVCSSDLWIGVAELGGQVPPGQRGVDGQLDAADARLVDVVGQEDRRVVGNQVVDARFVGIERPAVVLRVPCEAKVVSLRFLRPQVGLAEERVIRSEEHTSELQSLMRISYAVFCLK